MIDIITYRENLEIVPLQIERIKDYQIFQHRNIQKYMYYQKIKGYKEKLHLPYMGSKNKIAKPIVDFILKENPNTKYIYDLFGGGGSISFEAIQRKQIKKVFYNDIDTGITEIIKDIFENGITRKYYKFVNKETFDENIKSGNWVSGICNTLYSFGNAGRGYLYRKDIIKDKQLLHNIIIFNHKESYEKLKKMYGFNIVLDFDNNTMKERRLAVRREIKRIENLYKIEKQKIFHSLKDLEKLPELSIKIDKMKSMGNLQHLQRLHHLQDLYYLQRKEDIIITNKNYDDVFINTPINETIIYLDPPYENTANYRHKINYDNLYKWILRNKYKVYVSSYHIKGLKEVFSKNKVSRFSHKNTIEKLFVNR